MNKEKRKHRVTYYQAMQEIMLIFRQEITISKNNLRNRKICDKKTLNDILEDLQINKYIKLTHKKNSDGMIKYGAIFRFNKEEMDKIDNNYSRKINYKIIQTLEEMIERDKKLNPDEIISYKNQLENSYSREYFTRTKLLEPLIKNYNEGWNDFYNFLAEYEWFKDYIKKDKFMKFIQIFPLISSGTFQKSKWIDFSEIFQNLPTSLLHRFLSYAFDDRIISNLYFETPELIRIQLPENLIQIIEYKKFYEKKINFKHKSPLKIIILNASTNLNIKKRIQKLISILEKMGLAVKILNYIRISNICTEKLDKIIKKVEPESELIIGVIPEKRPQLYTYLSSLLNYYDYLNYIVYEDVLKDSGINIIALYILKKVGYVPFILKEIPSFTDYIIGLDVAWIKLSSLPQKIFIASTIELRDLKEGYITDKYYKFSQFINFNDGYINDLFKKEIYGGKRSVILRDGVFFKDERKALKKHAKNIGALFYLVEISKSRKLIRLFTDSTCQMEGVFIQLSGIEAILHDNPSIKIRTEPSFSIENAIKSVMLFNIHSGPTNFAWDVLHSRNHLILNRLGEIIRKKIEIKK